MDTMLEGILIELLPALEKVVEDLKRKAAQELTKKSNEEKYRPSARELREKAERRKRADQNECVHVAGCSPLSEQKDIAGKTSIVWHKLDTGLTTGICTVCQRIFLPEDKDYAEWRAKPSFNLQSSAGKRRIFANYFLPPPRSENENQTAHDQQPLLYEDYSSYTQDELYSMLEKKRETIGIYAYPAQELDALSDADITKLFAGVREYRKALKDPTKAIEKIFSGPEWTVGK